MRQILSFSLFLWFLFWGLNTNAQNAELFDESSYKSILNRSKIEHKPIFYMVYATWCPHCMKMKNEVFNDATVMKFLKDNFICAATDIDKAEGSFFKQNFGTKIFPSFLFLDENGTVLYHLNGEMKIDQLIVEAKNALNPQKQLPYLKQQFESDPGNAEKCLAYLTTLRKGKERKDLSEPAHVYLETLTDAQLVSEVNWRIIANAVTDIESREFQYVLQHQKKFAAITSPVRVERKILNIVTELLKPLSEIQDTTNYYKQREIAKTIALHKTDSLIFTFDIALAESTKNWKKYQKTTHESVEKMVWNDQKTLKDVAQNYLKNITDKSALNDAIKWTRRALEITDSYDGNLLLARLYIKIDDRKTAIIFARKAKELTQTLGWNSKEADALFMELNIK